MNNKRYTNISPIIIGTGIGIALSFIAFTLILFYSSYNSGVQIRPYDIKEVYNDFMKANRIEYDNLLNHYSDQIKIISSFFAFIAFLLTYQSKNKIVVTPNGWGFLTTGIISLILSLILSHFGKELLYRMAIRNSVDINLPALYISRLINYFCMIIAAFCAGFYALELGKKILNSKSKIDLHETDYF